uniref:hypothetical protein n=1 Tax=Roseivirga sp. TaxID=1964215 RepID=UPI004047B48C
MSKIRLVLYVAGGIVLVLFVLILIKLTNAPIAQLKAWEAQLAAENTNPETAIEIIDNPRYDSIQRQIALRKALLSLTKKDSMVLVVNLPDSSLNLFLNGVFIHNARIDEYSIDRFLKNLPLRLYLNQFSKPISIVSSSATIVKEPIIEKEAPKTPDEMITSLTTPDSLVYLPAYVNLTGDNGINLFLEQTEDSIREERSVRSAFRSIHKSKRRRELINSLIGMRAYDYQPGIVVKVTKIELTSIYRALPQETKVVLYYK